MVDGLVYVWVVVAIVNAPRINKSLAALLKNHAAGKRRKPIVCLEGSARSGKTWSILEYLITCCLDMPNLVVTAFRHDGTTHAKSTWRDLKIVFATKFPRANLEVRFNEQEKTVYFPNGSLFEFGATNDISKLHGPQRHIAWLNEVMEVSYEAWCQISPRTSLMTVMDWNPSLSQHWVFDRVLTRRDAMVVNSTYRDNPHLTAQQVAEIEKYDPGRPENVKNGTSDKWMWEVYGLGKRGHREGAIYTNWDIRDEEEWPLPDECQHIGLGVDFGFSDDPSAVIDCRVSNNALWLEEVVYERDLLILPSIPGRPSMIGRLKEAGIPETVEILCDGARPESIKELQVGGYPLAIASVKGAGSVLAGINVVKGFSIHVHRQSQNLQREFEQYAWKKNRLTGKFLDEPEDANNHAMDAVRYWATRKMVAGGNRWAGMARRGVM